MKLSDWEIWYEKILKDFKFLRSDDENTAKALNNILNLEGFLTLEELLTFAVYNKTKTNKFIVFGAGPSLKKHINLIKNKYNLDDYILVSADGATTGLLEEHIAPDIIVTDLDGKIDDILAANLHGSFMVIHGHGNNFNEINKYVPFFYNVLGTTQSDPTGNLYNFGGFTDGDRAIFLSIVLGAEEITLAGMDFGTVVTKHSRPGLKNFIEKADKIKEKKLKYAENLTKWIINNEDVKIINLP